MTKNRIEEIVYQTITDYCDANNISTTVDKNTPLIGEGKICTSIGLVNIIVDIETAFLEENAEISLTSEEAMSLRISPFRSAGALCNFIARQLGLEDKA